MLNIRLALLLLVLGVLTIMPVLASEKTDRKSAINTVNQYMLERVGNTTPIQLPFSEMENGASTLINNSDQIAKRIRGNKVRRSNSQLKHRTSVKIRHSSNSRLAQKNGGNFVGGDSNNRRYTKRFRSNGR